MPVDTLLPPVSREGELRRKIKAMLLLLLTVAIVGSLFCETASAARRRGNNRGRNRTSSAAYQAYRAQAIQSIQHQVSQARNVLANAESQASMSQAAVNSANSKLSDIREQIENAHDDVAQAAKALHDLEKEILADQAPNSELNLAQAVLQQAKNSMHDALHRVFDIPHVTGVSDEAARLQEFASLSDEQKAILAKDAGYQIAQRDMQTAAAQVTKLRRELFLADKQWVYARQELTDADQRSRKGTQEATTAGMNKFGSAQQMHSSQQVATSARSIIAYGEARLRSLGANPNPSFSSSQKKKKK
jgi:chromosome segregation ATPase